MAPLVRRSATARAPMQLIEQYIFRRVAVVTLSTLVVVTTIVLSTQLLSRVAMLTRSGDAFLTFVQIAVFLIPSMAMVVIPFALLVGAMRTLNAMNADSELAVLESAGRSPALTARPVVLLALLLTLASLLIAHVAEPWSNRNLRDAIARASADLIRSAAQAGTFQMIAAGSYLQIAEQLPGGEFGKLVLVDARDPKTELIYHAKRGSLLEVQGSTVLVLLDGEVHRRNRADNNVSIISFASTALDFTQFTSSNASAKYRPQEMETSQLLSPDPNNVAARDAPSEIRRELHRRMTEWLYPLVFGLIAAYFVGTARTNRQQQPIVSIMGGLLALVLRVIGFVAVSNSGTSTFFAAVTYIVPIGAIIVVSTLILYGGRLGTGPVARGPLGRLYDAMGTLLSAIIARIWRRPKEQAT